MGRMSIIKELLYKVKGSSPGKSIVLKTNAAGDQGRETSHYQLHGISSGPTPEDVGIEVSIGTAGRVIVATHKYKLEVSVTAGETKIFSTSADGQTLKSLIELDVSGNIKLNGDTKTFVTHAELDTAIQSFITALNLHTHPTAATGPPSPPTASMSLDISSAETTTIQTGG
jgi:hypothetical protein